MWGGVEWRQLDTCCWRRQNLNTAIKLDIKAPKLRKPPLNITKMFCHQVDQMNQYKSKLQKSPWKRPLFFFFLHFCVSRWKTIWQSPQSVKATANHNSQNVYEYHFNLAKTNREQGKLLLCVSQTVCAESWLAELTSKHSLVLVEGHLMVPNAKLIIIHFIRQL